MRITYKFDQFIDPLFESTSVSAVQNLRTRYSIKDDEWEAMRIIPEDGIDEKVKKYFNEDSKEFIEKIVDLVSDGIFKDSKEVKDFMVNIAAVESCFGSSPSTYKRPLDTKGIFQLDRNSALETIGYKGNPPTGNGKVKRYISECKAKIKSVLGLDWDEVPYTSISKPLYNALAARMFIGLKSRSYTYDKETGILKEVVHPIPETKKEQASWWKNRYNSSEGDGTTEKFINPPGCEG